MWSPPILSPGTLYDPIHRKAALFVEKRDKVQRIVRSIEEWLLDQGWRHPRAHQRKRYKGTGVRRVYAYARGRGGGFQNRKRTMRKANDMTDFVVFFREYGDSRTTDKTRKSYEYVWNILASTARLAGCRRCASATLTTHDWRTWRGGSRRADGGESTRHMIESYVRVRTRMHRSASWWIGATTHTLTIRLPKYLPRT